MTKSCFFLSDLHLSEENRETAEAFFSFLEYFRRKGKTLYVLGDLFDFWVGPRQMDRPYFKSILRRMGDIVEKGKREILLLRGNRDMYLGSYIEKKWGIQVLEDSVTRNMGGRKIFITHGDLLCSNDKGYLLARRIFRSPLVYALYQALPWSLSLYLARGYRGHSNRVVSNKLSKEREIVFSRIRDLFLEGFDVIICGHVHKARRYTFFRTGKEVSFFTLGGWSDTGSFLEFKGDFSLKKFCPGTPD